MTHTALSANPPDRPSLQDAFARILWDLLALLGDRARPAGYAPVLAVSLVGLIAGRLHRMQRRFRSLAERALAGTLRPVRPRASRGAAVTRVHVPDPLPRAAGWLAKLCPRTESMSQRQIMPAVAGLSRFLDDERLQALLASDPRFGRVLRPLWRMLRVDKPPECLRLPVRPRKPRAKRETPDIGLPIPKGITQRDLRRSRAMAEPPPQPPVPPEPPPTPWGTATDWTPTHLTLGRRTSVFDPIPNGGRRREPVVPRRWFGAGDGT